MWIIYNQHPTEGVVVFVRHLDILRMVVKDEVMMFYFFDDKNVMRPAKLNHLHRRRLHKKGERV